MKHLGTLNQHLGAYDNVPATDVQKEWLKKYGVDGSNMTKKEAAIAIGNLPATDRQKDVMWKAGYEVGPNTTINNFHWFVSQISEED
jgi:hypothetical protein